VIIYAWINGKFVSPLQAVLHVSDLGLLRGYAVFDYLRTCNGKPFLPGEYINRFLASAAALHLQCPLDTEQLMLIFHELAGKAATGSDIGIRLVLTGGDTPDGISPSVPNLIITAERFAAIPQAQVQGGVKLLTQEFRREIPEVKTTNYMNSIRFRNGRSDYYDVLYYYDGCVLETSRNNIFIFKGDKLLTPKQNVLAGVTRGLVLSLAREAFDLEERKVSVEELRQADEVFVTGTTKGILPVTSIDDQVISYGKPGERTICLISRLQEFMSRY
jgi:branched-chain amino acid aminotransferase